MTFGIITRQSTLLACATTDYANNMTPTGVASSVKVILLKSAWSADTKASRIVKG